MINAQLANMNIQDYCAAMDRNEIVVNKSYQRSDKVWPDPAKSYLIESVLLGYPIPKFYLNIISDPKSRRSIKEIVDGQQRSRVLHDFLNEKFALSKSLDTEELRGLTYNTLPEDWQGKFRHYSLSIDQFVAADNAEVRQLFRRMNSYTVPLNPEELRHAENQGAFKWFISQVGAKASDKLVDLGVFSDKAIVRMQDLKLYTEIALAIDLGISTTSKKNLDDIYRRYDEKFPRMVYYESLFNCAFNIISNCRYLKGSNIAKPYQIYSFAVAVMLVYSDYVDQSGGKELFLIDEALLELKLTDLSASLDVAEDSIKNSLYKEFIEASADRTNVKEQRIKRISAYRAVVEACLIPPNR